MTTDQAVLERRRWIALALLCVAQFVVVLDASITNVALPTIGESLGISQDSLSWVVTAYALTFGGFLLLGGRLADLLGRRRVFMGGLLIFAIASLVGGFAESEGMLIAARAVQGLGAAILSPAALSIITTTFRDGSERNKALGVWGAVAGSGGAAGVLLGGVLTEYLGWEWVLWVNVPIGIIAAALAPSLIAESRSESETRSFDVAGAITVRPAFPPRLRADRGAGRGLGLGSDDRPARGSGRPARRLRRDRAALGLAADAVLDLPHSNAHRSERGRDPDESLFSMFFFISLYMQNVLGYSAIKAGLSYLPLAVSIIIAAGVASTLVTRVGYKPILAAGMALIAAGLVWFSQISVDGSFLGDILGPSLLAAVGLGFAFVPQTIAAGSGREGARTAWPAG